MRKGILLFRFDQLKATLVLIMMMLVATTQLHAGNERSSTRLTGTDVAEATILVHEDNKFNVMNTYAPWPTLFTNKWARSSVVFGYDWGGQTIPDDQDITLSITVESWGEGPSATSVIEYATLHLQYEGTTSGVSTRSTSFIPTNGYKVKVTVTDIVSSPDISSLPEQFYLEIQTEVERYYPLDPASIPNSTSLNHAYDSQTDELEVKWAYIGGAEEYDLEWAYVNDYADEGVPFDLSSAVFEFKNNATRVTVSGNAYRIPCLYEDGHLVYRMRPVGRGGDAFEARIDGSWSSLAFPTNSEGKLLLQDFVHRFELVDAHMSDVLSWQYVATFAEQGKHKEVVSYFDGSQRNRQTVTRLSSTGKIVVGETVYDFQGRPAISILPVPTAEIKVSYVAGFNENSDGNAYTWKDFDADGSGGALPTTESMKEAAEGAAYYYSTNNSDQDGQQSYLPKAYGFPFTQTVYSKDNTGRVRAQSGVGPVHAIGTGQETRYYYGKPVQIELDRLFGTEVGLSQHYMKNLVVDPNGQASVSYLDMAGRTIATGLAGNAPDYLKALRHYDRADTATGNWNTTVGAVSRLTVDLLNKDISTDVDDLQDDNHVSTNGMSLVHSSTLINTADNNTFDFFYSVEDNQFQPCGTSFCYDIVYDLELEFRDENGFLVNNANANPLQYQLTLPDSDPFDSSCDSGNGTFDTDSDLSAGFEFTSDTVDVGSYSVNKRLTVNQEALDAYTESYIADGQAAGCIAGLDSFEYEIPCETWTQGDCDECVTEVEEYFETVCDCGNVASWLESTANEQETYEYNTAIANCELLCPSNNPPSICTITHQLMLADMTPSGQYAKFDVLADGTYSGAAYPLSIFNESNQLPGSSSFDWRSISYHDELGNEVIGPSSEDPLGITNRDFIAVWWQPSFSRDLVFHHPEYCYWSGWCMSTETIDGQPRQIVSDGPGGEVTSDEFDVLMSQITYDATSGWDNIPSGMSYIDFLAPVSATPTSADSPDPFFNGRYNASGDQDIEFYMRDRMDHYMDLGGASGPNIISMWKAAAMIVYCPNILTGTVGELNSCFTASVGPFSGGLPGSPETNYIESTETWVKFRELYFAEKQKFQEMDMNRYARDNDDNGTDEYGTCYSGCIGIGEDEFDFGAHYMTDAYHVMTPMEDPDQPCSSDRWQLYRHKERRFGGFAPFGTEGKDDDPNGTLDDPNDFWNDQVGSYYEETQELADYTLYAETGQCPLAMDILGFINTLAAGGDLSSTTPVSTATIPGFTADMYLALDASTAVLPAVLTYDWKATITTGTSSDNLRGQFLDGSTEDGFIQLEEPSLSGFDWDLVLRATRIRLLGVSGGTYTFEVQVFYDLNMDEEMTYNELMIIQGSTDIPMDGCSFEDICEPSQYAQSIKVLLNYLTVQGYLDDNMSLDSGNGSLAGNPEHVTQLLGNVLGTPIANYDWVANVGSDEFTITNGSDNISIEFTSTPGMSSYSDVALFADIEPTGTAGYFTIRAYINGDWNDWAGHISFTLSSTTFDFPVGECHGPVSALCQTDAHVNLGRLDDFLNDWIAGGGYDNRTGSDTVTSTNSSLVVLGGVLTAATIEVTSSVSFPVMTDYLSISMDSCEIQVIGVGCETYDNGGPIGCNSFFGDIFSLTDFEAVGEPYAGGYQHEFIAVALDDSMNQIGLVRGIACFPIANCDPCVAGDNLIDSCVTYKSFLVDPFWGDLGSPCDSVEVLQCIESGPDSLYFPCTVANSYFGWTCSDSVLVHVYSVAAGGTTGGSSGSNTVYIGVSEYGTSVWLHDGSGSEIILETNNTDPSILNTINGCQFLTTTDFHAAMADAAPGAWTTVLETDINGIEPSTDYVFEVQIQNMGLGSPALDDEIRILVDNVEEGTTRFTDVAQGVLWPEPGEWNTYRIEWTSNGTVSPADFLDLKLQVEGGDYALGIRALSSFLGEPCTQPEWDTIFPIQPYVDPCDSAFFQNNYEAANAEMAYNQYLADLRAQFRADYIQQAIGGAVEEFTMEYDIKEFQYTLYYYDQAGNLVKTVPPKGVRPLVGTPLLSVPGDRANGGENIPEHGMETAYTYNSLNQLVRQSTPDTRVDTTYFKDGVDAGIHPDDATYFWYDALGRIVLSQNPQQGIDGKYSYTVYDHLGRVKETGVYSGADLINPLSMSYYALYTYLNPDADFPDNMAATGSIIREEITITQYDEPLSSAFGLTFAQSNLRGRVASVLFFDDLSAVGLISFHGTHYSYDIHGNVKELYQDFRELLPIQRFFKISYEYDLVSGNVKQVTAPGFYHKYEYDADNRITNVWTSTDSLYWEQDAKYFYYDHGPLARTEIGDLKVQGIDHTYTLQGWLKAVNSNTLGPDNDMGEDAKTTSNHIHGNVAKDGFGFSLGYYHSTAGVGGTYNDYEAVNATANAFLADVSGSAILAESDKLYNGNISRMVTSLPSDHTLNPILGTAYHYDQLNRLIESVSFTNVASNAWSATPHADKTDTDYYTAYRYDSNGNLRSLDRNSHDFLNRHRRMDRLRYEYQGDSDNGVNQTNKLRHVKEVDGTSFDDNWDVDVDQQANDNYTYDRIGNLISDEAEEIAEVQWYNNGKIKAIVRESTSTKDDLEFRYDGLGNRVSKVAKPRTGSGIDEQKTWVYTYYIRDAQGNHLVTLDRTIDEVTSTECSDELHLADAVIYGSDRLGVRNFSKSEDTQPVTLFKRVNFDHSGAGSDGAYQVPVYNSTTVEPSAPAGIFLQEQGQKHYELKNHLGNVLATVIDKRVAVDDGFGSIAYYEAMYTSTARYYPFGMVMIDSLYANSGYRFGFNGKEKDDEVSGNGNQYDYGFRIYNPRVAKFLSVDPLTDSYPWYTPYQFAGNKPIRNVDLDGLEEADYVWAMKAHEDLMLKAQNDPALKKRLEQADQIALGIAIAPPAAVAVAGYGIWASLGWLATEIIEGIAEEVTGIPYFPISPDPTDFADPLINKTVKDVLNPKVVKESATSLVPEKKVGGRLGNEITRKQNADIATELESRGWEITGGGGRLPEEYLPPANGGTKGGAYPDITAKKDGDILRINTVDTRKSGRMSTREANNATRIRGLTPGDHLLTIPKKTKD